MNTDSIIRNARVLWRADKIMADIHVRQLIARTGLAAVAALVAVFGLLMLGFAAYLALAQLWGPIWAATAVGVGNFVIALVLIVIGSRIRPGRELELAAEVHRSALEALVADVRSFETVVRHPFDSALPGLIVPLATLLLKSLRKSDKA